MTTTSTGGATGCGTNPCPGPAAAGGGGGPGWGRGGGRPGRGNRGGERRRRPAGSPVVRRTRARAVQPQREGGAQDGEGACVAREVVTAGEIDEAVGVVQPEGLRVGVRRREQGGGIGQALDEGVQQPPA